MLDFFSNLFLESPIRLGVLAFLLLAAALYLRRRVREPIIPYVLPGAIALIFLLFLVEYSVVTDREEIIATLRDFVRAVEKKDSRAIADVISRDFNSADLSKSDLLAIINRRLARIRIYDTSLSPTVRVEHDSADMLLGARATISLDGGIGEFHTGTWRFHWVRRDDAWQITDLRPVRVDTVEIGSWRELQSIVP